MRPSKLIIQAFGPFAHCETIDFDLLGEHPLFLINGPTGAGKSSILDALCFALYGQTTGKDREASQMRCDHSPDTLLTEVTLEFELSGNHFRVYRCPTQLKPKSRGDGTTTHQTEARLWQLDGDQETLIVAKSASETTKEIEALTGLNVEQFRQVMVLPQGKFRDFLMADSQQRELIFSQLFQTQIYKRIEDALKTRSLAIKQKKEQLNNQYLGLLQSAQLANADQLTKEIQQLTPELKAADSARQSHLAALEQAQKAFNTAQQQQAQFDQLTELERKLTQLNSQQSDIDLQKLTLEKAKQAKAIGHQYELLNTLVKESDSAKNTVQSLLAQQQQLDKSANQARQTFLKTKQAAEALPSLQTQLHDFEQMKPKVAQLAEHQKSVTLKSKAFEAQTAQLTTLLKNIEANKVQKASIEASLTQMREDIQPLADLKEQRQQLHFLGKNRADLDKSLNQLNTTEQNLNSLSQEVQKALNEANQKQTQLTEIEMRWHLDQARNLATQLTDQHPCPVCGSKQHPNPAHLAPNQHASEQITRDHIDQAKAALEKAIEQHQKVTQQYAVVDAKRKHIQQQINTLQESLGGNAHLTTATLRQQWQQCDSQIKTLEALISTIEKSESELQQKLQQELLDQKALEHQQAELQSTEISLKEEQQAWNLVNQQVPAEFRESKTLETKVSQLSAEIHQIKQAHDKADQAQQNLANQLSAHSATLKSAEQQNQKALTQVEQQAAHWSSLLKESAFNNEEEFTQAQRSDEQVQQLLANIDQYQQILTLTMGKLEQQKQQLEGLTPPNLEQLSQTIKDSQQVNDQAQHLWQQLQQRLNQLTELQDRLSESQQAQQILDNEYAVFGTLSEVANGQTGNKISLQRFVLSVLLDDVLIEASSRLHHMSKGRYQLLRKEQKAKGNKASGLELEVEDAYTGRNRAVSTLSGGESFMAALSLALGLSDVVQAYSGGIHLDTLFIDEGFGSLDQESLDLAIKTLTDLQASGRMIGIISHVSELKEQMPLRIDVLSQSDGSIIHQAN